MAGLYARDPADPDVASLYALALLGTMSRSLIGYVDAHEGHSSSLAGSETQTRVGEILGAVLKAHPEHPGALHYLLHNYDDPAHASLGLDAARVYAKVAPQSSHALHMPAHIFLQLGLWVDAEASDRAAFAASEAWVKRKGFPPALRSYHSLAWRQYQLLQLGRFRDAALLIDEIGPVVDATGDLTLVSDLSSMRARQILETRRWEAHGQRAQLRQRQRAVRHRVQRRALGQCGAGRAGAAGAGHARDLAPGRGPAAGHRHHGAPGGGPDRAGREARGRGGRHPPGGHPRRAAAAAAAGPADAGDAGSGAARRSAARSRAARRGTRGVWPGARAQRQSHTLGARFGPRGRARSGRPMPPASITSASSPTTHRPTPR